MSLAFGDFLPLTERGERKPKVPARGRRIQRGAVDCLFSITVGEELYLCKSVPVARMVQRVSRGCAGLCAARHLERQC